MKIKMNGNEFNRQLRDLCKQAMEDGDMNVFEILGCLTAAKFNVDRNACMAAQHAAAKDMATKIQPATILPAAPQNKN